MNSNVSARILFCCLVVLFGSAPASAVVSTFTDRNTWRSAAGATTLETFNSFVSDVSFHTVPVDVGQFTMSISGVVFTDPPRNSIDAPPITLFLMGSDGTTLADVHTDVGDSLFLNFDAPLTAFGADFGEWNTFLASPSTVIVAAGEQIAPPFGTVGIGWRFFGFNSTVPFSSVELRGLSIDGYAFDNVEFHTVPEPLSAMLLGLGLIGSGVLRRRAQR
jgi:hypothetical protein